MTTLKLTRLTEIREQRLLSRAELARRAEISPLTVLKIEKGHRCRPETARKIISGLSNSAEDNTKLFKEIIGPDAYSEDPDDAVRAELTADKPRTAKLRKK
jgi:DNA-binding XRE family transcriptional regulator